MAIFEGRASGNDPKKPIVLRSCEQKGLHDLLYNDTGTLDEEFNFYEGLPTESSEPFMKRRKMKIVDVPRYDHFDKADDQYPEFATYILYGEVGNAYLFHSPTKDPDYLQVKFNSTFTSLDPSPYIFLLCFASIIIRKIFSLTIY